MLDCDIALAMKYIYFFQQRVFDRKLHNKANVLTMEFTPRISEGKGEPEYIRTVRCMFVLVLSITFRVINSLFQILTYVAIMQKDKVETYGGHDKSYFKLNAV